MIATWRKLFDLLSARERRRFALVLALAAAAALSEMAGVAAVLPFLAVLADPAAATRSPALAALRDGFGVTTEAGLLGLLAGLVFAMILVTLCLKLASLYGLARFAHMRNHTISTRMFDAVLRRPYSAFLGENSADTGRTMLHEVDRVVLEAMMPAIRFLAHGLSLVCLMALLLWLHPQAAAVAGLTLGGAYVAIFLAVRRALKGLGADRARLNAERYRIAAEALSGVKDIKVRGIESAFTDRYGQASLALAAAAARAQAIGEVPRHVLEAIAFGGMIALVLVLLMTGGQGLMAIVPTLGVFAFAGLKMFPALQQMYHALTLMRFAGPMLDAVHARAARPPVRPAPAVARPPAAAAGAPHGQVELRHVSYTYPGAARPALSDVSATIPARSSVGIVGGSGAGKTTLVDLMLGLLVPERGEVRLGGASPDGGDRARIVGYVPQTVHLTDDTLAANIAFGLRPEEVDMAAVERAARAAQLHDFALSLPAGYATGIGERGARLSGGERQRIGIARALYADPAVLIFDEATSALDPVTEREVMAALRRLSADKTVVIIAHRLSTVKACDRILLLEGGRIAAEGSYAALAAGNARFRRLAAA
ncbi:MAG: ABC transporter ATP-binding protein/permease [Rhodobacteraceae bacterium]|nr:ABC transporter ATP-binding protein/permease [Paracoccaceae bacterium]